MRTRLTLATGALTGLELAVCLAWWPQPSAVLRHLEHPYRWVASAGADQAAADLGRLGLWAVAAWLLVGSTAVLAASVPGRVGRISSVVATRAVPRVVRVLIAGSLGAAVAVVPAAADAASVDRATTAVPVDPASSAISAVPIDPATSARLTLAPPASATTVAAPAADVAGTAPAAHPAAGAPRQRLDVPWPRSTDSPPPAGDRSRPGPSTVPSPIGRGGEVLVTAGDSLWLIAARRLEPASGAARISAAAISAAWPRWYQANSSLIGDDPNLIRPGQRLRQPSQKGR